jgi:hypothetical protein
MYSRTCINDLLAELAADMPRMMGDMNTFFREYEDRSEQFWQPLRLRTKLM